jgi:UDP-glucose 4-epimerase
MPRMTVQDYFSRKRVFITGGSGFIAAHLIKALRNFGSQIFIFDRVPRDDIRKETAQFIGDLNNYPFLERSLIQSDPDIIFHLAAAKDRSLKREDFENSIDVNIKGAVNLFDAASRLKNLSRLVVLGTAEEYGDNPCPFKEEMPERPVSSYSYTKMCISRLCQMLYKSRGTPFVVARPTLAFGPGQATDMFLPALISSLANKREFVMTRGEQTRDYIYIDDLVEGLINAAYFEAAVGEIINLGSGTPLRIKDIAEEVAMLLVAPDLLKIGQLAYRPGEIMEYYVDYSKASGLLQWSPKTDFRSGLQKTISYYLGLNR